MTALEKKAIEAALDAVIDAQVELPRTAENDKTDVALKNARSWLEVFFVVEEGGKP